MAKDYEKYRSVDYSYRLSDEYDQSLIDLPNAVEFILERGEDWQRVSEAVSGYTATWHTRLLEDQLYDELCQMFWSIVAHWNEEYEMAEVSNSLARDDSKSAASVVPCPPAAILLNDILEAKIPHRNGSLFGDLFSRWMQNRSSSKCSANFLAFILYVRVCPDSMRIYQNPIVLNAAFDTPLILDHWNRARGVIESMCPTEYATAIEDLLSSNGS